jgi:hypothetical protein
MGLLIVVALLAGVLGNAPAAAADYPASCAYSAGAFQRETIYGVAAWTTRGSYMSRGQACQIGKSRLAMQTDGNLVLYDETGRARWAASWTRPEVMGRAYFAYFQNDNNYVLYDNSTSRVALWASNTYTGVFGGKLAVQADGNLVVYDSGMRALWATHTAH